MKFKKEYTAFMSISFATFLAMIVLFVGTLVMSRNLTTNLAEAVNFMLMLAVMVGVISIAASTYAGALSKRT